MPESSFRVNLAWGRYGVQQAAARGDVIVIVDVFSFSSVVAIVSARGGLIYPCTRDEDADALAARYNVGLAFNAPELVVDTEVGTRLLLPSANGATLCRLALKGREDVGAGLVRPPSAIVGCLLNAAAVSGYITALLDSNRDLHVTVVAAGERHPHEGIRFALEDYLGAGAVLSNINQPLPAEAEVCASAFVASKERLRDLLWNCVRGQELVNDGYTDTVQVASQLDSYPSVPVLGEDGWIRNGV